jgi:hypothetical protein
VLMESVQASLMEQMEKIKFLKDEKLWKSSSNFNVVEGSCDFKVPNDYFESICVLPSIKPLPKSIMEKDLELESTALIAQKIEEKSCPI